MVPEQLGVVEADAGQQHELRVERRRGVGAAADAGLEDTDLGPGAAGQLLRGQREQVEEAQLGGLARVLGQLVEPQHLGLERAFVDGLAVDAHALGPAAQMR